MPPLPCLLPPPLPSSPSPGELQETLWAAFSLQVGEGRGANGVSLCPFASSGRPVAVDWAVAKDKYRATQDSQPDGEGPNPPPDTALGPAGCPPLAVLEAVAPCCWLEGGERVTGGDCPLVPVSLSCLAEIKEEKPGDAEEEQSPGDAEEDEEKEEEEEENKKAVGKMKSKLSFQARGR